MDFRHPTGSFARVGGRDPEAAPSKVPVVEPQPAPATTPGAATAETKELLATGPAATAEAGAAAAIKETAATTQAEMNAVMGRAEGTILGKAGARLLPALNEVGLVGIVKMISDDVNYRNIVKNPSGLTPAEVTDWRAAYAATISPKMAALKLLTDYSPLG